jgi:hypothetical protein
MNEARTELIVLRDAFCSAGMHFVWKLQAQGNLLRSILDIFTESRKQVEYTVNMALDESLNSLEEMEFAYKKEKCRSRW